MPPACSSSSRRSPQPSAPVAGVLVLDGARPRGVLALVGRVPRRDRTSAACARRGRRCRPRRHDGLRRRGSGCGQPRLRLSSVPCARPRRMPRTTASSSSSTAAGVRRRTRSNSSVRRSRSTAQSRRPPAGWPPRHVRSRVGGRGRHRALRCRGVAVRSTAPRTGCARSTATSPGTTSCAPRPSITAALPCTPTRRTIQGCSSDDSRRSAAGRPCAGRPDRRGLWLERTVRDRHRQHRNDQRHRSGQGGEVRRVHARATASASSRTRTRRAS